jgi:colanic acid biosynthesis glycosyl transferase WcaI
MHSDLPVCWVASELYFPEKTSTGNVMTRIAEHLALDWNVRVLCAQPTYAARGHKAPRAEVRNGARIQRVRSTTMDKDRPLGRALNQLTITASTFLSAIARFRRGDAVLVVTNPPTLPVVVGVAAFLRGARYVVLVHDLYPDVVVVAGLIDHSSIAVRIARAVNRAVLRRAAAIIVLGRDMRDRVETLTGVEHSSRVHIIPNWADVETIKAGDRRESAVAAELGIDDRFVVQYAGNISPLNDIETLVKAIDLLRDRREIHFLFAGSGARRAWLVREIERRHLDNTTVVNWPREEAADELRQAADVVLISLLPGMWGISVPSRMYNALAAGKAIIAAVEEESEVARVVREDDVGWVVPPGDAHRLAATIAQVAGQPVETAAKGARARAVAESKYAAAAVLRRFTDVVGAAAVRNDRPTKNLSS